jgi:hypothetical protein
MIIKASTSDADIASKFTTEEILAKFHAAKAYSNRWSAEADRLRKFIQTHVKSGKYGNYILEKKDGTPRVQATSAGNAALQAALVIDVGLIPPKVIPGQPVWVVNVDGETITQGNVVDNKTLYTKNPPKMVNLTEIPDED